MTEALQQRVGLHVGQSGVSLLVGTLQPFKRLIGLATKRIHLGDLIGPISAVLRDKGT